MRILQELNLPQEIEIQILRYLDLDDIHELGKHNVPKYLWMRIKYKTIKEAIENNDLLVLKYLIKHYDANVNDNNDYAFR